MFGEQSDTGPATSIIVDMTLVVELAVDAVDWYTDTLATVAAALAVSDVGTARERLEPIGGELWTGHLPFAGSAGPVAPGGVARSVSDRTRAQVFLRDHLCCTYCGVGLFPVAFSWQSVTYSQSRSPTTRTMAEVGYTLRIGRLPPRRITCWRIAVAGLVKLEI